MKYIYARDILFVPSVNNKALIFWRVVGISFQSVRKWSDKNEHKHSDSYLLKIFKKVILNSMNTNNKLVCKSRENYKICFRLQDTAIKVIL